VAQVVQAGAVLELQAHQLLEQMELLTEAAAVVLVEHLIQTFQAVVLVVQV
jgi:hypothetical protein